MYVDAAAADETELATVASAASAGATVAEVQPGVLARVCDTVTPQPVAATVRQIDVPLGEVARGGSTFVVVLAGVSDPGNAGSLLRSAAAAGAGGVVTCCGSVDLYNPKTVRASAGAIFRIPVAIDRSGEGHSGEDLARQLRSHGLRLVATAAAGGAPYTGSDLSGSVALVLGNEAHGLPPGLAQACDSVVSVPMHRGTESLGVAAAGAVIFFEAARQRRLAGVAGAA